LIVQTIPYINNSFSEEVLAQIPVETILFQFPDMTSCSAVVVKFKECIDFHIGVAMNQNG